jgi:hypothetical protein
MGVRISMTTVLSKESVTRIRTFKKLNIPVYFYFEGELFEYNNFTHVTEKLCNFKGFNCAVRKENFLIDSFEFVEFDGCGIEPIFNPLVSFTMPDNVESACFGCELETINFAVPVNREHYTALEHFAFTYPQYSASGELNTEFADVNIAWTRFSDPKKQTYIEPQQDKWIYAAKGFKCFAMDMEHFNLNFDFEGQLSELINR